MFTISCTFKEGVSKGMPGSQSHSVQLGQPSLGAAPRVPLWVARSASRPPPRRGSVFPLDTYDPFAATGRYGKKRRGLNTARCVFWSKPCYGRNCSFSGAIGENHQPVQQLPCRTMDKAFSRHSSLWCVFLNLRSRLPALPASEETLSPLPFHEDGQRSCLRGGTSAWILPGAGAEKQL